MIVNRKGEDVRRLARFQTPVREDLQRFRRRYRETLESGHRLIDRIVAFVTRTHGKGLRPTLTLLCARLGGGEPGEAAIRSAVIVELLHEATLVHDDVVDEAPQRRGLQSLAARFRNKVSVLFGDYMLANVLTETLAARDLRWLDILAETARRMARGELLEAAHSRRLDLTEEGYIEMIGHKTAALFGACCRMGALTGGLTDRQVDAAGRFGESFGIAFQIKDDLLDLFGDGALMGKPTAGDLKERKLTLPLLSALARSSPREARRIRARIRRGVGRRDVRLIADFVHRHGGVEYAERAMAARAKAAIDALEELPPSRIRDLLAEMAEFAVARTR